MKKFISGVLVGGIVFGGLTAFAYNIMNNPYPIKINGQLADIQGYNKGGKMIKVISDIFRWGNKTVATCENSQKLSLRVEENRLAVYNDGSYVGFIQLG